MYIYLCSVGIWTTVVDSMSLSIWSRYGGWIYNDLQTVTKATAASENACHMDGRAKQYWTGRWCRKTLFQKGIFTTNNLQWTIFSTYFICYVYKSYENRHIYSFPTLSVSSNKYYKINNQKQLCYKKWLSLFKIYVTRKLTVRRTCTHIYLN